MAASHLDATPGQHAVDPEASLPLRCQRSTKYKYLPWPPMVGVSPPIDATAAWQCFVW